MKKTARIRILSLLTMLAFMMNVFIPFFAVYDISSAQAAEKSELSSFLNEKIFICTADGFKWVTWEELQQQGEDHPQPDKQHYECPLCYVSAHSTKDFLPVADFVFKHDILEQQKISREFSDLNIKNSFIADAYQSRAPPDFS